MNTENDKISKLEDKQLNDVQGGLGLITGLVATGIAMLINASLLGGVIYSMKKYGDN